MRDKRTPKGVCGEASRSGDELQQHGEATCRSDKSPRVYSRIFVKIVVSATEFCRCDKSQNIKSDEFVRLVAATKFCCSDLSPSVYRPYTKY